MEISEMEADIAIAVLKAKQKKKKEELDMIQLLITAQSTHTLNRMLIELDEWSFKMVPGTHVIYQAQPHSFMNVSVVVRGPKRHAKHVQSILIK